MAQASALTATQGEAGARRARFWAQTTKKAAEK